MEGIYFIEKNYKNLYNSYEVQYENRFYHISNIFEYKKNYIYVY